MPMYSKVVSSPIPLKQSRRNQKTLEKRICGTD